MSEHTAENGRTPSERIGEPRDHSLDALYDKIVTSSTENDAAHEALDRLADQAFHTAGDDAGRQRVLDDRAAVMRFIPPGSTAAPTGDPT